MNPEKLFDYLDGNLPADERAKLEEKLATDPQLQRELDIAREMHRDSPGSREVVGTSDDLDIPPPSGKLGRFVATACIALVTLNVTVGLLFIIGSKKSEKRTELKELAVRQQIAASLERSAETTLPVPTLDVDEIRLTASPTEREQLANNVVTLASQHGGSATKAPADETGITVLAELPGNRAEEFRQSLAPLAPADFSSAAPRRARPSTGEKVNIYVQDHSALGISNSVNDGGPMIAVTFALPAESSDFVRLLAKPHSHSDEGVKSIHGHLHDQPVSILHTGVGEEACRPRIQSFLCQQRPKYLISAGFAGALDNQLRVSALLIAKNFSSPALLSSPHLDLIGDSFLLGRLVTASGIIDSKAERDRLATESGAVAVDMETEFIAAACTAHGIPMLSLRVMSDTPSEPLPAPPNVLFDVERQKTNFGRLAIYLATHPDRVKPLAAFRKRVVLARRSLTTALNQLLRADLMGPT